MPTVVLSGANRGLGLEFARQYAAKGARVFAGARDLGSATALNKAAAGSDGRLTAHSLDVADDDSVRTFANEIGAAPVDILIANAGVIGGDRQHRLDAFDAEAFMETLSINTGGPLRLVAALHSNLKAASGKFIAITSDMGSIAEAGGGYLGYRASKAGLNMVMRALANDLKSDGVVSIPLSPGWAKTDMGGPGAPQPVDTTIAEMIRRIDSYTLKDSGRFLDWNGRRELPW